MNKKDIKDMAETLTTLTNTFEFIKEQDPKELKKNNES